MIPAARSGTIMGDEGLSEVGIVWTDKNLKDIKDNYTKSVYVMIMVVVRVDHEMKKVSEKVR